MTSLLTKPFGWLIAFLALCLFTGGCSRENSLAQIKSTGRLSVITDNSAHSYFIYREKPMGFEYELAKAFADYLGVDLTVLTPGWDDLFKTLNSGRGDIIAASLTITDERRKQVDFSSPYLEIQQFVIVHRENREINTIADLDGRDVYVRRGSSYHERLEQLRRQGINVKIHAESNTPTEVLIGKVARKEIEITIADSNVALLNRRYYPQVIMAFPLAPEQSLGWAVRKGRSALRSEIDRFFKKIKSDGTFHRIYYRYYSGTDQFDYVDLVKFERAVRTKLPEYKSYIQQEAARFDLDWRLIAAIIYQESHFNPMAESYTGVRGLMQLTMDTAEDVGVMDRVDPLESISGGVQYLAELYKRFSGIQRTDRMLFALAGYNVGYGHVKDAQQLSRNQKFNPYKWLSIRKTLPLLQDRNYYRRTTYGYARGSETVHFVENVMEYYDILRYRTRH
jgi:membrane-bound lytic murein transglycosylase F